MARIRWWAMYLTSCAIGYAIGGVQLAAGARFSKPLRELVDPVARGHAEDAANKIGSYLAPFTFLIPFAAIAALALIVRVIA